MTETLGQQKRRLDEEIDAAVKRMRAEGQSLRAIGEAVGMTHPAVLGRLRRMGVSDAITDADRADAPSMDEFMRDRMPGATAGDRTPATADEWMRQRAGTLEPTDDPNGTDA